MGHVDEWKRTCGKVCPRSKPVYRRPSHRWPRYWEASSQGLKGLSKDARFWASERARTKVSRTRLSRTEFSSRRCRAVGWPVFTMWFKAGRRILLFSIYVYGVTQRSVSNSHERCWGPYVVPFEAADVVSLDGGPLGEGSQKPVGGEVHVVIDFCDPLCVPAPVHLMQKLQRLVGQAAVALLHTVNILDARPGNEIQKFGIVVSNML